MKYKSIAEWPPGLSIENNTSTDVHGSRAAAEAVCRMLREKGLGGDGRVFPIHTRVEPILEPEQVERLIEIGERLHTQDNRITQNPMFCVRIKIRDFGYDSSYSSGQCWHDSGNEETIYDDDPDFKQPEGGEWEQFGYRDRWEIVMVAFTEDGCKHYLELNGHNDRSRAFRGEVEIYVESFNRCPEMILIREWLMALPEMNPRSSVPSAAKTLSHEP